MKIGLVGFNYIDITDFELSFLEEATELVLIGKPSRKFNKHISDMQIPVSEIILNYREHKKDARLRQNLDLIKVCDRIILFWDIDMPLNTHLIENCIKQKKPIIILPCVG